MIALLILAAGIPGVLLQLRTAPEIHRVAVRRRYDRLNVMSGMLAIYIAIAMLFIWWFPTSPSPTRPTRDDWSAGVVISLVLVLTGLLWLRQIELTAREQVVRRLMKQAHKEFRKRHSLSDMTVADILDMGTSPPRSDERRLVLREIETLIRAIVRMPDYKGDGLDQLLEAVGRIAADPGLPADDENVLIAANVLLQTSRPLRGDLSKRELSNADRGAAMRILLRMLTSVSQRVEEATLTQLLQQFANLEGFPPSLLAKGMFQIGRRALMAERAQVAVMCLNHLESLLPKSRGGHEESVESSFLGLAACLWSRSETARRQLVSRPHVTDSLRSLSSADLRRILDIYGEQSDFETGDLILSMHRDWLDRRRERLHLRRQGQPPSAPRSRQPQGLLKSVALAVLSKVLLA